MIMRSLFAIAIAASGAIAAAPVTSPEDRTAAILAELDNSGPFIVSTEGDQLNVAIWWVQDTLIVTHEGELVADATTQIDAEGRICFSGRFDQSGHAALSGKIDLPANSSWLAFDLSADNTSPVHISPDLLTDAAP